ncbi:hypothetical protein HZF08_17845 [Paenibacillus sp. CGMCC 1.16610]|jgi:hypothetical protein|uniref:Pyridoxamine 5'-phosphate oxidase putative domain-containing protein n=3 Tax=Paenibacillus TaxID=44249 RepID=A0ABU3REJ6_9BACL|nr:MULTISPECIES: hypothetical protein [Paenibacillus]MBA2940181.1 hypothetical protein [Paenibacillus sp. CGMCC 1.16610]MCY9661397.1 hypothetical protein [Paenibacillus anseongense]MDU0202679.1 hypothetical protein [Paenibacillus sp. PFR10]MEB4798526.1 hypothetical protein [Paenibacillus chondroitinus]MEC0267640.1 hypothetical protein [Paenibacillus anseongense]
MSEYILVSTTDRYRTVTNNPNLELVAAYEYYFFGKKKTLFEVCKIVGDDARIIIQGVSEKFADNSIPLKVFPKFDSTAQIEKEIYELDIDKDSKIVKTA